MPLHWKTKESAVNKYKALPPDQQRAALQTDINNYSQDDIEEILAAIVTAVMSPANQPGSSVTLPQTPTPAAGSSPNAAVADQLSAFDYNNLRGDAFKRYCLLVQSLPIEGKYDFEVYQVEVAKQVRYRGVKDSPIDMIGFRMVNTTPIHCTRIPVKYALTNNGRVEPFRDSEGKVEGDGFEVIGSQLEHNGRHGRYYLLKKVS